MMTGFLAVASFSEAVLFWPWLFLSCNYLMIAIASVFCVRVRKHFALIGLIAACSVYIFHAAMIATDAYLSHTAKFDPDALGGFLVLNVIDAIVIGVSASASALTLRRVRTEKELAIIETAKENVKLLNNRPVLLSTNDLHKTYKFDRKGVKVLKGVSITVHIGETLAVMGASGSGKSTLLNCLGGLDKPSDGQVFFYGCDLNRLSATTRTELRSTKLSFVFQAYHLLPELNVLENVLLPALARHGAVSRRGALERRALELLDCVGLNARATHRPTELSGGEQQRVALARALMNEPELVLADEPTGNLDAITGEQVLEYLFHLTRDRGHTLVIVTHNADIAARCDRTLVLRDGVLS
jgi:ABC-type lipoprotein export system ATPase subunit